MQAPLSLDICDTRSLAGDLAEELAEELAEDLAEARVTLAEAGRWRLPWSAWRTLTPWCRSGAGWEKPPLAVNLKTLREHQAMLPRVKEPTE